MASFLKKLFLKDSGPQFTEQDYDVGNLKNLPIDCRKLIHRAGLTPNECNDNYDVLLSVLWFEMKKSPLVIQILKEQIYKTTKEKKSKSWEAIAVTKAATSVTITKDKPEVEEKRLTPDIGRLNVYTSIEIPKSSEKKSAESAGNSIPEIFVPEDDDNDLITTPTSNSAQENKVVIPQSTTNSNSGTEKT